MGIINGSDLEADSRTAAHAEWAKQVVAERTELNAENVREILREEVGKVFVTVLEHAGVYKRDENGMKAFDRFMAQL